MLSIELQGVSKAYPRTARTGSAVTAVDDVSGIIQRGEIFFLLGPSGCGKTTLLRILAGFVEPTAGRVLFDGQDVTRVGPERRHLAMVFQNYALWPHMTVEKNVEFGPRTNKVPADRRRRTVDEVLAVVGMEDRRQYKPTQLSGGQQQRVALARALAVRPKGLLFDEPLSNLDARLRARMRGEIRRIVKDSGATAVYVTHDQEEAFSMADRIAVMNAGRIVQVGTPQEIYRRPANRFVADFVGEANFLPGVVSAQDGPLVVLETPVGKLRARPQGPLVHGMEVICCVRPESVRRCRDGATGGNVLSGECIESVYLGHLSRFALRLPSGTTFRAATLDAAPPRPAEAVAVHFDPDDAVVLTE